MPAALNAAAIPATTYTDAQTVQFVGPRSSFSVTLGANAAAYYQLGFMLPGVANTRDVTWEHGEHHLVPGIYVFRNPEAEGGPPGSAFAGVRFRALTDAIGTPVVTVA